MTNKENPLQRCGTRAGGRSASGIVAELLLHGQENAISRRELENLTDWSGRVVRRMIERERRASVPILSDNEKGYFLPENSTGRAQFVRSMRNHATEILKTAQAVECSGKG